MNESIKLYNAFTSSLKGCILKQQDKLPLIQPKELEEKFVNGCNRCNGAKKLNDYDRLFDRSMAAIGTENCAN